MSDLETLSTLMLDALECVDPVKANANADELLTALVGYLMRYQPTHEQTLITYIVTTWETVKSKHYPTAEHPFMRVPMVGNVVDGITGEERRMPYRVGWHKVYDDNGEIGDLT